MSRVVTSAVRFTCGVCLATHKPPAALADRSQPLQVNGHVVNSMCRDCAAELELSADSYRSDSVAATRDAESVRRHAITG